MLVFIQGNIQLDFFNLDQVNRIYSLWNGPKNNTTCSEYLHQLICYGFIGLFHSGTNSVIESPCPDVCAIGSCFQSIGPLGQYFLYTEMSVCVSMCPSVRPSVCVFTFEVPFKRLFAPTSPSRMSNIFRDLESLGKSNGKKWSQIGTFQFGSGLKSANKQ